MRDWICPRCLARFRDATKRCPVDGHTLVEDLADVVLADRYLLQRLIGVGGMGGSVWKAWQRQAERPVAVKVLPAAASAVVERFEREARIIASLSHPHITVVHDFGHDPDGHMFLVMELLEGTTLRQLLKRVGLLPLPRALRIVDQVLRALDYAHRRNVIHRDLKTGNLFLATHDEPADFVKLLDFGIAKVLRGEAPAKDDGKLGELADLTSQGQLVGTPHYMAPEQIVGDQVDARTDLYAVGVVLFRMLTGRVPFEAAGLPDLFRKILTLPPPGFAAVRPDLSLPSELEDIVHRAVRKTPGERFASARDMRQALRGVRHRIGVVFDESDDSIDAFGEAGVDSVGPELAGPPPLSDPTRPSLPIAMHFRRHRVKYLAVCAGLGLGLALALWLFVFREVPPESAPAAAAPPAAAPMGRAPESPVAPAAAIPAEPAAEPTPRDPGGAPAPAEADGEAPAPAVTAGPVADALPGQAADGEATPPPPGEPSVAPAPAASAAAAASAEAGEPAPPAAAEAAPPAPAPPPAAAPRRGPSRRPAPGRTPAAAAAAAPAAAPPATPPTAPPTVRVRVLGEDGTRTVDAPRPAGKPDTPQPTTPRVRVLGDP